MIIVKQIFNYTQTEYIEFDENEDKLSIKYYKTTAIPDSDGQYKAEDYIVVSEKNIDLKSLFSQFTRFAIFLDKKDSFSKVFSMEDYLNSRDGFNVISEFYDLTNKSIVIYFNEVVNEFILISYLPTIIQPTYIHRDKVEFPSEIISELYPAYAKKMAVRSVRREMLEQVDPNNSLAYIEAQLDLLSTVVFSILDSVDQGIVDKVCTKNPFLPSYRQIINNNHLSKVKTIEKCLGEIEATKSVIRNLQSQYYSAKENL